MSNRWAGRLRLAIVTALAVAVAGLAPRNVAAQSGGFIVVVNASNPTTSISKTDLSKLFTKKSRQWPSGSAALPVDLSLGNPVRDAFTERVHGKSARAIGSYWQQQIFSGRDVPPPERKSDEEVLDYVRSNAGAVGYVAAGTKLGAGVKAIAISE
ncbi:MAG: hypothetical protein HOQ09_01650 [Gemmatimonadaceae bacterium]|nr:hypothetical protein [Gemmatimonadaceae bacterium]